MKHDWMRMSDVARRFRRLTVVAAGLAVVVAVDLPAAAAQAATAGYTPPPAEWWTQGWSVPQQVWPLSEGSGVTVGVVDSGVQASTPDLSGAVLRGGDLLGDPGHGDRDFDTAPGHGTFVAEMIAGQGIDGGPVGMAPKAKILPVHVNGGRGAAHGTTPSLVAGGIRYAVDHGASVVNISLAGSSPSATLCDPIEQSAVSHALAHNVVVVAGAGDINLRGPGPQEPASCAGVLAVGGVEPSGTLWQDSTRQPYVSVAAPGDHILGGGSNGQTGTGSGTSFSAPLAAGVAALIRSKYPSMPWYQVDQRIIDTAFGEKPVPNDGYGYGIVNPARAVDASRFPVSASGPNPPYTRYLAWLKSASGQNWAQANGVKVPGSGAGSGSGSGAGQSGSGSSNSGSASSATAKSSPSKWAALIIVVLVLVLAVVALVLALLVRSSARRRSRNPGGPGTPGGLGSPGGPGAPGYPGYPGGRPSSTYAPPPAEAPWGQAPPPQDHSSGPQ